MTTEDHIVQVKKIVSLLMACSKNLFLYPIGHPQTRNGIDRLWQSVFAFLRSRPQLVLSFTDCEIFFEHDLLVDESLSCQTLLDICAAKRINRISFLPGLTQNEVAAFLVLLNKSDAGDFAAALIEAKISHIEVKRLLPGQAGADKPHSSGSSVKANQQQYDMALTGLTEVFSQAQNEQPIAIERVDAIVEWLVSNIVSGDSTMVALTALRQHDEYTCHHSINVAILAVALAHKLGLDRQRLVWLGTGALLHDIGKINIPKEIINKPGRLTADEWQIMKRHPVESTQILSGLPTLESSALIVAFEHHIGYDLSGYPVRSQQRPPHLFSRMVQITDTYDGLTSKRSYHAPYLPTEALHYMLCVMPQAFDPLLLKLFVLSLGIYPVGSVVKLSTDQLALVVEENQNDLLKPRVKIVDDSGRGRLVDLAGSPLSVKQIMNPSDTEVDLAKELLTTS